MLCQLWRSFFKCGTQSYVPDLPRKSRSHDIPWDLDWIRTHGIPDHEEMLHEHELPPPDLAGYLERKHSRRPGGEKATMRSWKTYYTGTSDQFHVFDAQFHRESMFAVLVGQSLYFFKGKKHFDNKGPASAPEITINTATCEVVYDDHTARKKVF